MKEIDAELSVKFKKNAKMVVFIIPFVSSLFQSV